MPRFGSSSLWLSGPVMQVAAVTRFDATRDRRFTGRMLRDIYDCAKIGE